MPSNSEITTTKLSRLIGLPEAPAIVDVRTGTEFASDPRLMPCALRKSATEARLWAPDLLGRHVILVCSDGGAGSQGAAAWLRRLGVSAETLEGGYAAWRSAGGLLVEPEKLPQPDDTGATVWVTRARPKIDRIACPWLIRRFIDPKASFLFVGAAEVTAVAGQFGATPFDLDGVYWSHRGDLCTFDAMLLETGLHASGPLQRLARIVRAADTDQLELEPQAAGFLACSLGLSRMFRDDLEQLEAGMLLYDALFRWCRDATDETHNWPSRTKQG
ncbi:sulfurtransferase [Camelimonas fluminis]|uniref:Chromate resistance protein ChrB domain-containing protein n=1 Tax=Camelimonas fluminis TaxID=1576911 RepID=A0ABV7UCC8_9HYPH|nr:sulfurtransferase/chromate resistance protein [Camelimonas fluminis]GHE73561.1 sulfurtransferase [Camelimonas fluminis]